MSDTFKANTPEFAKLELALAFGLLNLALAIESDAKVRCPYKTGNLRRSLHSAAFSRGNRIYGGTDDNGKGIPAYVPQKGAMAVVGTNAGYGVFVELGTVHMNAQPYLGPALADNRGRASELIKAGMTRSGVMGSGL